MEEDIKIYYFPFLQLVKPNYIIMHLSNISVLKGT